LDHIDAEPGSTEQVIHFAVKVTGPRRSGIAVN
jgi:hypothetical protein